MKIFWLAITTLIILIYLAISSQLFFRADCFKLSFFDVGQGDSALIITPGGQTILIDGGPDLKVLRELGKTLPFWRRQIDLMVITHAHDDHISGLIEVSRRYQVKKVLYNNLNFTTPVLKTLLETFKENKISLMKAVPKMTIRLDNNCSLSVLSAASEAPKNDNDYSVVVMFNCLNKKVLLSGDAGVAVEKYLLTNQVDLAADIFKVAHHGSLSASSPDFLAAIKPRVAIISVGADNKFGHPAPLTLDKLKALPVDIYRTDKSGTINFLANYKSIILKK